MRQGFLKVHHAWPMQANQLIKSATSIILLNELAHNAPEFRLGNRELAKRLNKSLSTVKSALQLLHGLGLIVRVGKLTPQGYKRILHITPEARRWIAEGIIPDHLSNEALSKSCEQPIQEKFPGPVIQPSIEKSASDNAGDEAPIQEKFPRPGFWPLKKNKNKHKEEEGNAHTREAVPPSLFNNLFSALAELPIDYATKKRLALRAMKEGLIPAALKVLVDKALSQSRAKHAVSYVGAFLGKLLADQEGNIVMCDVKRQAVLRVRQFIECRQRIERAENSAHRAATFARKHGRPRPVTF